MMNRRNFIRTSVLGAMTVATSPLSFSADGHPTVKTSRSGRLNLKFMPYELKLKHSFNLASSQRKTTPDMQIEIEYDGIIGYGEASLPPYLGESIVTAGTYLSSLDLNRFSDPFAMEEIHDYLDSVAPGNRAAKAAVDIALHDLAGKIMGQPWYKIWGLDAQKAPNTSYTVSYDADPAEQKAKIAEAAPFKVIKVKMGLDHDKELVKSIREVSSAPICVDANQGWRDKEMALEMCHWLNEHDCLFVEQPMPKEMVDETAWLKERSPLPIIADEFVQRLDDVRLASQAYDGINIKLMKSTGMHEAYKMAVLARALGMKVMIGCMTETSCAVSAAAQLSPMAEWADLDGNLLISNDRFEGIKIVDGKIIVPDRPGIGIKLL